MDYSRAGRRKARQAGSPPSWPMADTGPAARGPAYRGLLFHGDLGLRFYVLDANHCQEPVWVFQPDRLVAFCVALLRGIGRHIVRGMVIRPDRRKTLAHCAFHGYCRDGAGAGRGFAERSPHGDRDVLRGRSGDVRLHSSFLVFALRLSHGNGSGGVDWLDQFHWKSWRICRSLYCRLPEQDNTFPFRGGNLSFSFSCSRGQPGAVTPQWRTATTRGGGNISVAGSEELAQCRRRTTCSANWIQRR